MSKYYKCSIELNIKDMPKMNIHIKIPIRKSEFNETYKFQLLSDLHSFFTTYGFTDCYFELLVFNNEKDNVNYFLLFDTEQVIEIINTFVKKD